MGFLVIMVVSVILGVMIGSSKGKAGPGFALGLLLGPLGVLIVLFMKPNTQKVETAAIETGESKKCPYCGELIKTEAIVCRYCGRDLVEQTNTDT